MKTSGLGIGEHGGRIQGHIKIVHAPAAAAEHVLMRLGPGVVQGRPKAGTDPPGQVELDEQLQGGVDGGSGRAGEFVAHGSANLVRRRVVAPAPELPQDDVALRRGPLAAAVQ